MARAALADLLKELLDVGSIKGLWEVGDVECRLPVRLHSDFPAVHCLLVASLSCWHRVLCKSKRNYQHCTLPRTSMSPLADALWM